MMMGIVAGQLIAAPGGQPAGEFANSPLVWEIQATPSTSRGYGSVCWSPDLGKFVATAFDGSTLVSTDGIAWSYAAASSASALYDVIWTASPARFTAMGLGKYAYSLTGAASSWTTFSLGISTTGFRGIVHAPELGLFVATDNTNGSTTGIRTTPTGSGWVQRTTPPGAWYAVCWSPDLALLVATSATSANNPGAKVMTSPDGINWTSRSTPSDQGFTAVCWSKERSLFVASSNGASGNDIMTSPDGVNWTLRASPAGHAWRRVIWVAKLGRFVATGSAGGCMTSPDGVDWTLVETPAANYWSGLVWSDELNCLIATATTGTGNQVMKASFA